MSQEERHHKEKQLIQLASSVLDSPVYKKEFNTLMNMLNTSRKKVIQEFLNYNLDIFSPSGNSVYESIENRIVLHIHNQIKGSWHIQRQSILSQIINGLNLKTIADIGFGVPSEYIKYVLSNKKKLITLCDLYESAFIFSKTVLTTWARSTYKKQIKFKKMDMNNLDYVGNFDLYIFQDSIEHAKSPELLLEKYVNLSSKKSNFLFSLPIGPIIPRHYINWNTKSEALKWLKHHHLKVINTYEVYPNPKIDLFSKEIPGDFYNIVVLCQKYN